MEKFRMLVIAPNEDLKKQVTELASKRNDFEATILLGDLAEGCREVLDLQNQGYDAIISRGGTAEMIREVADIPLVPIRISPYDMFRVIKLAQNYTGKYAIVGYSDIAECAHIICDLLQYKADIFTVAIGNDAEASVKELKDEGYSLIVGDTVNYMAARRCGMNGILLPSGRESIESAFDEAIQICRAFRMGQKKRLVDEALLNNIDTLLAIYRRDGSIFSTNLKGQDLDHLAPILESKIPRVLENVSIRVVKKAGEKLWVIRGVCLPFEEEHYAAFYITPVDRLSGYGHFIKFESREDCLSSDIRNIHFNVRCMEKFCRELEVYGATREIVLILGEEGTEKDETAKTIYMNGALKDHPFVIIDCAHLRPRDWKMIRNHSRSPLFNTDQTIYFKDVDCLSQDLQLDLEDYLEETLLQRSNRVLFSCSTSGSAGGICQYLIQKKGCLTLSVPPLRDRTESLASYASLYISGLNVQFGKQVVGFDAEALKILRDFPWKYNVDQFKRVLKKLFILSTGSYISAEDAAQVLEDEESLPSAQGTAFDLNRSLEEIEKDIIMQVLKSVDMNQTRAAKILGIGRSTLWRKLNENVQSGKSSDTAAPD